MTARLAEAGSQQYLGIQSRAVTGQAVEGLQAIYYFNEGAGDIVFDKLETPDSIRDSELDSGILIQEEIILGMLPPRLINSHKGNFGWLAVVGSDAGMSGAVRLAGEAALRRIALPPSKYWVTKRAVAAVGEALECLAGNGYAEEYKISRVLCDARILNIFEGAGEIQAQVIGRRLLEKGGPAVLFERVQSSEFRVDLVIFPEPCTFFHTFGHHL